ncbi:MAG: hypothetical protein GC204_17075 [Chloroflexi bacterium]|nr:hypothetical protein [Chloroflexota bacterium]
MSGDYTADDIGLGDGDLTTPDGYIIFYPQGGFDPANSPNNCVDAVDDTGTLTLAAGRYTMVITTFSNGATGPVIYSIDGPGEVNILSDVCANPLPSSGTAVLAIPNGAPAYFSPSLQDSANFSLPAGTWHIINVSGDFAQVWIACQGESVWVLKSAIVGDLSHIGQTTVDLTTIGLARSGGACPYILPSDAVVESLADGATAYFAPDLQDGTNFNVPAGRWWVVYTYGDFSEIWISCQADPVWVPTKDLTP